MMKEMKRTTYNEPDRAGFDKDLALPLQVSDKMLAVDYGEARMHEFTSVVKEYGSLEAQKYWNHFHMGARSEDLAVQRQWAYELLDSFREKARLCENVELIGEIKDDGFDIEVTFFAGKCCRPN